LGILLDTGVLYAIYDRKDVNHLNSVGVVADCLKGKWGRAFLSSYVVLETTLLLQSKLGPGIAREFVRFVGASGVSELVVDEDTHAQSKRLFLDDKGLSLTDASTMVLMKAVDARNVATFDVRSFSKYRESVVGPGYWESLGQKEREALGALEGGKLPADHPERTGPGR
jgi:predicted nucleic acid-binding protein